MACGSWLAVLNYIFVIHSPQSGKTANLTRITAADASPQSAHLYHSVNSVSAALTEGFSVERVH